MAEFLLTSDPKSITPAQYRKLLREFLEERLFGALEGLVLRYSGPSEHTSVEVSCHDLIDFDPSLGYNVVHFPKLLLPIFDEAIFEAQTNLCSHPSLETKHGRKGSVKINCHIRIVSLPPTEYLNKPTISDIRADDIESLIQISGKVVRTGAVRMLETSKKYECQNPRCMYRFTILADPEQDNMLPQPRTCPCPNTDSSGASKKCHSTNLRELEGFRVCVDYQELKIQDSFERVSLGSIPRSIAVILEADLVDKFNAGDDVIIVGVLVRQWKPVWKGARCVVDIALRANSILALNAQDRLRVVASDTVSQFDSFWNSYRATDELLKGRDVIIRSICPQLYGLFFVKLALLLTLVGGSATQSGRGVKRRSQSHLLVVGDPGCGKSQILRFAASVVSRSVLTTGIGTSGAGLTCTAVRDGSDWSLEAGALVLANDGVCCIDEFASIKDQDRVTIHEAMEQQSISVAKAGLVVKLNTRATVLACCNPKGTYDVSADISTNTAIASPLLSRFDLVLVLLDTPQKEWDKRVSTFLLQQAVNAGVDSSKRESRMKAKVDVEETWDLLKLRDYITYVKHHFQPTMSRESQFLLMRYYQMQRQSEERSSGRTTVRLLESLMRLSEAHAKIMSREVVLLEDAVVAVACVNLSQEQSSLLDTNSTLHSDFPSDPKGFYAEQEAKVFSLLHCTKQSLLRDIAAQDREQEDERSKSKDKYSMVRATHTECDSEGYEESPGVPDGDGECEVFPVTNATALSDDLDLTGEEPDNSSNADGPRNWNLNLNRVKDNDKDFVKEKSKGRNIDQIKPFFSGDVPRENDTASGCEVRIDCRGGSRRVSEDGNDNSNDDNDDNIWNDKGRIDRNRDMSSKYSGSGGDVHEDDPRKSLKDINNSDSNAWGGRNWGEEQITTFTSSELTMSGTVIRKGQSQAEQSDPWTSVPHPGIALDLSDREHSVKRQSYFGKLNDTSGLGQGRRKEQGEGRVETNQRFLSQSSQQAIPYLSQPSQKVPSQPQSQPRSSEACLTQPVHSSLPSTNSHNGRTNTPLKAIAVKISRTGTHSDREVQVTSQRLVPNLPPGLHRSPLGKISVHSSGIDDRGHTRRSPTSARKRFRANDSKSDFDGGRGGEGILDLSLDSSEHPSVDHQSHPLSRRQHRGHPDNYSAIDMKQTETGPDIFGVMDADSSSLWGDPPTAQEERQAQPQSLSQPQAPLRTTHSTFTIAVTPFLSISSLDDKGETFDCEDW